MGKRDVKWKSEYHQSLPPALHESVDVIGLSLGGRYRQVRHFMDLLNRQKIENIIVMAGGTIPRRTKFFGKKTIYG